MTMKRPYQVTAVVILFLAAFVARESLELKFYTTIGPGPGFFPLLVSILVGFLGAAMLFHASFRVSDPMPADFIAPPAGYLRVGAILVAVIAVIILMKPLGFRLTMTAFLAFLLLAFGHHHPLTTAAVALVGGFGMYQLFAEWLTIPLPLGMFGF